MSSERKDMVSKFGAMQAATDCISSQWEAELVSTNGAKRPSAVSVSVHKRQIPVSVLVSLGLAIYDEM